VALLCGAVERGEAVLEEELEYINFVFEKSFNKITKTSSKKRRAFFKVQCNHF
jgi:hypothetical protein